MYLPADYDERKTTSSENSIQVQIFIANILLDNYGRFLEEDDKIAIHREISRIENSSSPIDKNDAAQKLDDLINSYSLLSNGYLLNIVGHSDVVDPVSRKKALEAFNQFMAALEDGNVQKARNILSLAENLLQKPQKHNVLYDFS